MNKKSKIFITGIFTLIFLITFYLEIFSGHISLNINDFISFFNNSKDLDAQIIGIIRFPRALKAIIAGSCLAISGMFLQTITKNPLVEPYFTGVSSGAGLSLVLSVIMGMNPLFYCFAGFAGAIIVSLAVILLTGINKFSLVKLILVGLSINIFVSSVISSLILFHSDKAHPLLMVLTGNINSSTLSLKPLLIFFALGIILSVLMVPKLNFMVLDGTIIKALSPRANMYFIFMVVLASYLASLSVCAAGILGFIGIIIPHLSRLIIGQNFKNLFFINLLLGSSMVLLCDFISRNILFPTELPLGLVIAIIGAPIFLLFLILRGKEFYA